MARKWEGPYVTHTCKFCECAFVAEDYTHVTSIPPTWRACPECCEKRGIDYNMQRPSDGRTPEQLERYKKSGEILKKIRQNRSSQ